MHKMEDFDVATTDPAKRCDNLHGAEDLAGMKDDHPRTAQQPLSRYCRFRIERVVFLATFAPTLGVVLFLVSGDPEAFMAILFVPLYYVLTYVFVKIDGRRIGSLVEECTERGEGRGPSDGLTLRRYLMEYVNFVGVVLALFVFIAGMALGASLGNAEGGGGGVSGST